MAYSRMLNDQDLSRGAGHMKSLYGPNAALQARRRAADLLKAKQAEAAALWAQIATALANADREPASNATTDTNQR